MVYTENGRYTAVSQRAPHYSMCSSFEAMDLPNWGVLSAASCRNMLHSRLLYKYNVSVNNTTLYFIYNKMYCQGDIFRPFLVHLQALWENRSKSYLYFNALWDPKCLQIVLHECEINKFVYIAICVAVSALKA